MYAKPTLQIFRNCNLSFAQFGDIHVAFQKTRLKAIPEEVEHTESSYFPPFTMNMCMHKGSSSVLTGKNKMLHVDQNPIIIYYDIL